MIENPEFWEVTRKFELLFYIAIALSFICTWNHLKNETVSCTKKSTWIIQYIVTSISTAVLAVSTTMLVPYIVPVELSYEIRLGLVCYICVFGVRSLDSVVKRKFGFSLLQFAQEHANCDKCEHKAVCPKRQAQGVNNAKL